MGRSGGYRNHQEEGGQGITEPARYFHQMFVQENKNLPTQRMMTAVAPIKKDVTFKGESLLSSLSSTQPTHNFYSFSATNILVAESFVGERSRHAIHLP